MRDRVIALLKFLLSGVFVTLALALAFLFIGWPKKTQNVIYGVTYSKPYAESLGLKSTETLKTILDEIGIRNFRIPAYWGIIQPKPETWFFDDLDEQIREIGKRGGRVTLAIGEKLPRWPECWGPEWWKKLPREKQRISTMQYLEKVVTRYRDNPTVIAWQVENEPHFFYGDCAKPDTGFILDETKFVRGLDGTRPIYTTDSGELSTWIDLGAYVDRLGVSVYRIVRNPLFGDHNLSYWFVPPYLYARKAILARPFGLKGIYVSEFQMEPWSNTDIIKTPIPNQLSSFDLNQMKANFSFAERMQIPRVDFWGVEWWIWITQHGHPEYLEAAKAFWKGHS